MRHIVTISLVFFSLTHLAKAEQKVEGLKILTERCCNRQLSGVEGVTLGSIQSDSIKFPFFLSANDLTLIGTLPEIQASAYKVLNHIVADLTIRKNAKNNSP